MADYKEGWKVIQFAGEELWSATAGSVLPHAAVVVYEIGKWAEPRAHCGPLCVFAGDHEWSATDFARRNLGPPVKGRIYKCLYRPAQVERIWFCDEATTGRAQRVIGPSGFFPAGTQFADAVKVLEP